MCLSVLHSPHSSTLRTRPLRDRPFTHVVTVGGQTRSSYGPEGSRGFATVLIEVVEGPPKQETLDWEDSLSPGMGRTVSCSGAQTSRGVISGTVYTSITLVDDRQPARRWYILFIVTLRLIR